LIFALNQTQSLNPTFVTQAWRSKNWKYFGNLNFDLQIPNENSTWDLESLSFQLPHYSHFVCKCLSLHLVHATWIFNPSVTCLVLPRLRLQTPRLKLWHETWIWAFKLCTQHAHYLFPLNFTFMSKSGIHKHD